MNFISIFIKINNSNSSVNFIEENVHFIFSHWWYPPIAFAVFFLILYFGGVFLTNTAIKYMCKKNMLTPLNSKKNAVDTSFEIKNSLLSIFVFSIQAIPFYFLYQKGIFKINFDNNFVSLLWEIPIMFLWNEIHFYLCHVLLHRPFFMKHVHKTHHMSTSPTTYSIYSFHWFESLMLGSVIFFPMFFHAFHFFSVVSLPVMSIILNLLGHCNHEYKNNLSNRHFLKFTFRHTLHHKWSQGNYGFMLPFLDKIFKTDLPEQKQKI